ncbi:MAG: hypothetical protein EZS28_021093 [Streblomastix strix]|uniref:Uncharacterized protein n=1 Tax=Streblomastix strix TaxID=222440 RepID=A0A5J4VLK0_9EUKA|nr:MAG: hypothetical protein EZS28_021093 [Streblomastix strix]
MRSAKIRLYDLAIGQVQLERFEIEMFKKGTQETTVVLSFDCYFQELCVFAPNLHDLHGQKLLVFNYGETFESFKIAQFWFESSQKKI